ncbi:hypothetical protein [Sphingomonas sp. 3P27F8]|uniref:hypothetical protein n=1 Tax=Sphingomonas sp. 3P27F8 TaxID=2502213 RepID=UPI0010F6BC2E|nr:hypothetical protein [Sphingomonas sp. 3P27F8]
MSNRYISAPLEDLLLRSGLTATKVDAALQRRSRMQHEARLYPSHTYQCRIRQLTGVRIVGIERRYGRLLARIEHIHNNRIAWQYFERSRTQCQFNCPGNIPHTISSALIGRPLSALAIPTPTLGEALIASIEPFDGWLGLDVTPKWHTF